jgi:hypothetical protein
MDLEMVALAVLSAICYVVDCSWTGFSNGVGTFYMVPMSNAERSERTRRRIFLQISVKYTKGSLHSRYLNYQPAALAGVSLPTLNPSPTEIGMVFAAQDLRRFLTMGTLND